MGKKLLVQRLGVLCSVYLYICWFCAFTCKLRLRVLLCNGNQSLFWLSTQVRHHFLLRIPTPEENGTHHQTQRKLHLDNQTLLGINVPTTRVLRTKPTPVRCIKTHAGIISRNENQKRPSISAFSLDFYGFQVKRKHLPLHKVSHFIVGFSNTFWMSTVIFDDVVTPKCDWRDSSPTHQSTCSVGS